MQSKFVCSSYRLGEIVVESDCAPAVSVLRRVLTAALTRNLAASRSGKTPALAASAGSPQAPTVAGGGSSETSLAALLHSAAGPGGSMLSVCSSSSKGGLSAYADWSAAVLCLKNHLPQAHFVAWAALLTEAGTGEAVGFMLCIWAAGARTSGPPPQRPPAAAPEGTLFSAGAALAGRAPLDHSEELLGELAAVVAGVVGRRRRERAQTSLLLQRRFLATMSHELRTPLNAVRPRA